MDVVLLGLGLQGRAALHDLATSGHFTRIVAVDGSQNVIERARVTVADPRVCFVRTDLTRTGALSDILRVRTPGVVVDLTPIQFISSLAKQAIESGWHYVNTYYTLPELEDLAGTARKNAVAILPEFGFDPGIDLVLAGRAAQEFDTVTEYLSYGGGIPAPEACTNPLNYKVSWIFEGVLNSYYRVARVIADGKTRDVPPDEIFAPGSIHTVSMSELGELEAFPNGDAAKYVARAGWDGVRRAGRYAMRWPGHSQFWYVLAKLGLLEDTTVDVGGVKLSQRKVLAGLLESRLQYAEDEADLAILRVEVAGVKGDGENKVVFEMIDRRDPATGLMAMNRTVGFTAAIGAQMIAEGAIPDRGLLNPLFHVPFAPFVAHLASRGIRIVELSGGSEKDAFAG